MLHAYVAAGVALVVCGIPASLQQHKYSPILKHGTASAPIDWSRVAIVALILARGDRRQRHDQRPVPRVLESLSVSRVHGLGVLLLTAGWRRPDWSVMPADAAGHGLPALSGAGGVADAGRDDYRLPPRLTAFGLGFVSAVFDNIPLTKLALEQGGYDWGVLAYAVGFGGSMIWFGSSAGVALTNLFPGGALGRRPGCAMAGTSRWPTRSVSRR